MADSLHSELARAKPLHHFRIAMIEEAAGLLVKRADRCHIFQVQLEVEDREVLGHPLLAHGLRDGDDVALDQPPEHDLCDALAMFPANRLQEVVGEQPVLSLRERTPCFGLNVVFLKQLQRIVLVMEWMDFDLIDRGGNSMVALRAVAMAVALWGVSSSIEMAFGSKLMLTYSLDMWDFNESTVGFFINYASIVGLYAALVHDGVRLCPSPKR